MLWCIRGSNSALPPNDGALALPDRLGQLRRTLEVPSDAAIGCDAGRQGLCIACPERDRHPKLSVSPLRSEPPPVVSLLLALRRQIVIRSPIAVCSVLRRGNWNSALAILNKHLAVVQ
jgi:hypothetical protein